MIVNMILSANASIFVYNCMTEFVQHLCWKAITSRWKNIICFLPWWIRRTVSCINGTRLTCGIKMSMENYGIISVESGFPPWRMRPPKLPDLCLCDTFLCAATILICLCVVCTWKLMCYLPSQIILSA